MNNTLTLCRQPIIFASSVSGYISFHQSDRDISSRFSSNSEAKASKLLEMCLYTHSEVFSSFKFSTTQ